jgi:3-oxoacyl-[acyl-carrier-protein] synthase-3
MNKVPAAEALSLLLCGFGVGWSWATAVWQTEAPLCHDIIRVA